jgi:hypothetical protein
MARVNRDVVIGPVVVEGTIGGIANKAIDTASEPFIMDGPLLSL